MGPFVIVTPVLNGAHFIVEALRSVTAQSEKSWVHYVVDGGSTDGTQDIVRRSMTNEPRRHLIEGKDRGLYDAIFKGFAQAKRDGHYEPDGVCVWLNSDDMLMPWALATLRSLFHETQADWVSTLPSFWDSEGRLTLVSPYAWHPRPLIRLGLFHGRGLGWIQQESTFFTRRLLDRLTPAAIEQICGTRLAGDFLLWGEFARYATPLPVPVAVSGFRSHGMNASTKQVDKYYAELTAAGVRVTPSWLGRFLRLLFRPIALICVASGVRARVRHLSHREGLAGRD